MLYTPPVAPTDSSVSASSSDWTSLEVQKVVQAITLRGRIRRNKVSVGEPAEGSLLPFIHLARLRAM